jgi:putative acetyltransferase
MERITVRRARPADLDDLMDVYRQPRVIWGTLQLPYPSEELWRTRLGSPPDGLVSLVAEVDGRVVGHCALHTNPNRPRKRHAASLGMAVHDGYHGRGVGTALMAAACDMADKWLNILRLELEVYPDNEPALRLYTKFGFVVEGRHIRNAFRDGRYVDSLFMARLKPGDWV